MLSPIKPAKATVYCAMMRAGLSKSNLSDIAWIIAVRTPAEL
jgi:hypothetical protein